MEVDFKQGLKRAIRTIMIIAVILIGAFLLMASVFTVDQTEYAVVTTFGTPTKEISEAGLRFKIPFVQQVRKASRETFSLTLGYANERDSQGVTQVQVNESDSKMITGDENIILVDLEIQWRISDPIKYFYNVNDKESFLKNIASSALREVIGSMSVDDALTDGRSEIISQVKEIMINTIGEYDMGVQVVNVNLQDVDLPNEAVSQAFKQVADAREERLTKINKAITYQNKKMNELNGQVDEMMSKALGTKTQRIEKAKGDVAQFEAIYSEYAKSPQTTKQRLLVEMLNVVLPEAKLYIMDDKSGNNVVKYLPIQ